MEFHCKAKITKQPNQKVGQTTAKDQTKRHNNRGYMNRYGREAFAYSS